MRITRNHWFMLGLVVLFFGIQFQYIQSLVLNEKSSRFVIERWGTKFEKAVGLFMMDTNVGTSPRKKVPLPSSLSWSLIAVGSVLVLHSFAMPKPG